MMYCQLLITCFHILYTIIWENFAPHLLNLDLEWIVSFVILLFYIGTVRKIHVFIAYFLTTSLFNFVESQLELFLIYQNQGF